MQPKFAHSLRRVPGTQQSQVLVSNEPLEGTTICSQPTDWSLLAGVGTCPALDEAACVEVGLGKRSRIEVRRRI